LLAADKRLAGDLEPGTPIAKLPPRIAVTPEQDAPREQLAPWADAVCAALGADADAVATLWSLAQAVGDHGLDPDAAVRALAQPTPPVAAAIGFRVLALAGKTADKRESTAAWRSPRDRARRLSVWLDHAAQALTDIGTAAARLSGPDGFERQEAFYLRSTLWGHQVVSHRRSLAQSLRDRAIRVLLARQCAREVVAECADDPSARYPLTAVEAMMRGQGLDGYSQGLA
jgi:hypothetical protein